MVGSDEAQDVFGQLLLFSEADAVGDVLLDGLHSIFDRQFIQWVIELLVLGKHVRIG